MTPVNKAIAAALAGAITGGGTATVTLPADTPWWGYLIAYVASAAFAFATTYLAPKNVPSIAPPQSAAPPAPPSSITTPVIALLVAGLLALSLSACSTPQGQAEAVTQACAAYSAAVSEAVTLRDAGKLSQSTRDAITQAVQTAGPICENPANYTSTNAAASAAVDAAAAQIKGAL